MFHAARICHDSSKYQGAEQVLGRGAWGVPLSPRAPGCPSGPDLRPRSPGALMPPPVGGHIPVTGPLEAGK